jgi:intracellular sulfur oxidation DsrE/DsrF family protein
MRPIVLAAILMAASPALAQPHLQSNMKVHHVVIQIDQDDPAVMNLALNNADNMKKFYEDKGEKVEIEFVAFGAGLAMMRSDKSPVKKQVLPQ